MTKKSYVQRAHRAAEQVNKTLGESDMTTKEGRSSFVWNTWFALAPWGYEAYLTKGRGAVVVIGDKDGPQGKPQYWPAGSPGMPPELEEMIRNYDPEIDIVVMLDLTFSETGNFKAFGTYGITAPSERPPTLWAEWRKGKGPLQ